MRVVVNGEERSLPPSFRLGDLLRDLGLQARPVAVERNGRVVPKGERDREELRDGDRIEIVTFVGGG